MQNVNKKCIFWKKKYNESTNKSKKPLMNIQRLDVGWGDNPSVSPSASHLPLHKGGNNPSRSALALPTALYKGGENPSRSELALPISLVQRELSAKLTEGLSHAAHYVL